MSRIGKKPISVPAGVTVTCENNHVTVKGPKGEIAKQFSPELGIAVEDGVITVTRPTDDKEHRSLHGLTRTLIANMVEGVTNGYSKTLIIEGVGYRAAKKGKERWFLSSGQCSGNRRHQAGRSAAEHHRSKRYRQAGCWTVCSRNP